MRSRFAAALFAIAATADAAGSKSNPLSFRDGTLVFDIEARNNNRDLNASINNDDDDDDFACVQTMVTS